MAVVFQDQVFQDQVFQDPPVRTVDRVMADVVVDPFEALVAFEAAADRLARAKWAGRPGEVLSDAMERFTRAERQAASAKTSLLGAFDASGQYRLDGHPSAATWLADRCRADRAPVNHQRTVARKLRSMPGAEAAFAAGRIGPEHVAKLAWARTDDVADAYTVAEADLVAAAQALPFDEFCRKVVDWRAYVQPDAAEKRARDNDQLREAHASRTLGDRVRVDAWLDALGGTEFLAELHRIEKEMFDADWAEARARVGENATKSDLRAQTPEDAVILEAIACGLRPLLPRKRAVSGVAYDAKADARSTQAMLSLFAEVF